MAYIRLTLATPPPERLDEVRQHYEALVAYVSTLPGFVTGWVVVPGHGGGEVGRLTVWESEAAAHQAATDPHALALHARVQFAAAGRLWDRSFDTDDATAMDLKPTGPHDLDPVAAVRAADAWYHHLYQQQQGREQP